MQNLPAQISYETVWNLAVQLSGRTPDNVPQLESDMLQSFFAAELEDLWRKEAWPELCDNLMQVTLVNNQFSNPYQVNIGVTVSAAGDSQANGAYTSTDGISYTNTVGATLVGSGGTWTISTRGVARYTLTATQPIGSWTALAGATLPAPTSAWTAPAVQLGDVLGVYNLDPRVTPGWRRLDARRLSEGNGVYYVNTCLQQVWVDWQLPCPDLLDPSLVGATNEAALMAATLPGRFRLPLAFRGASLLLNTEDPALAGRYLQMAEVELTRQAARLSAPWWRTETGRR